jgi:Phage major capsid protein E
VGLFLDSLVGPQDLTTFVRNVPVDQQYFLDRYLPNDVINDVEVEIKDVTITQRTAKYRAWDTAPKPGERDVFATKRVKLPAVSQMLGMGELDRIRLQQAAVRGGTNQAIINAIYDDAENNTRSVLNRVELARGDLLNDGKVTLTELGTGIEADFAVPGGHIVTAGTLWSDTTNGNPLVDLLAWQDTYRATNGFDPGGIVTSRTVLTNLLNNAKLRNLFSSSVGAPALMTRDQLNGTLSSYMLPPILDVYDAQVNVDGVSTRILPANKIWFVPPPNIRLGRTVWGLTATGMEMDSMGVQVQGGPQGIVGVVDKDPRPPYRQAVYVDATALPVLDNARALFIATVG